MHQLSIGFTQTPLSVAYDVTIRLEFSPELTLLVLGTQAEGCLGNCAVNASNPVPSVLCPKIDYHCIVHMETTMKVRY